MKLRHLEAWTEARRANARIYNEKLAGAGIGTPREMPYARHVYHVYAIRVPDRDRMLQHLNASGVQVGVHYPIPLHLQPAYRDGRYKEGDFPVAESVAREVLSLPMFPEMTRAQIDEVCASVRGGLAGATSGSAGAAS